MTKYLSASRIAVAALVIASISLGLNIFLLSRLRAAEAMVAPALPWLEQLVADDGVFRSEVRLPAGTPLSLDIPIDEQVNVAVDTVLAIDAQVVIPIRSPIGSYDVPVPIRSRIPVRTTLPLRIRHNFQLRTQTSEDIIVPIEIGG